MVYRILAVLLLLIFLFLIAPLTVDLVFVKEGVTVEKHVRIGIGRCLFPIRMGKKKQKKRIKKETVRKQTVPPNEEKKPQKIADIKTAIEMATATLRYLKKRFTIARFSLQVMMGLGDAADTGIAVGAAYATLYPLLAVLDRTFILKQQALSVVPHFDGMRFDMKFHGTFQLRTMYAIGLFIRLIKEYNKTRKEDVG